MQCNLSGSSKNNLSCFLANISVCVINVLQRIVSRIVRFVLFMSIVRWILFQLEGGRRGDDDEREARMYENLVKV